ncbi:efflux RND transporter periplasmic adaptor subunit [Novosphingobium flavum]|uniref:Efflux RND transporter periplasmic adaptor subunit n=1 Tax=Novosphingobium flavum TaxID=1778672 RepID=A0A7X1FUE8_9SPHN|nr:efflux RND transporter periplasmic adaptor subunit [Novosphingobium flavum]MBC2667175.1 efflux RND transporter periplasmic adaptor subunit [Novosphingobium flavum]
MKNHAPPFRLLHPVVLPLCLTVAGLSVAGLSGCGKPAPTDVTAEEAAPKDGSLTLSAAQIGKMGIRVAAAQAAAAMPVGTVPGVISLPPDARVAVTTPYAGTVVRIMVIQGQVVRQGEALAVVRAAEAVQFGAALARSQAELPVAAANAARLNQLAREGIIAPARADEARAALQATQATVAENRRLLALGGASRDGTIVLRAPISGRVAAVSVDVGAAIGNGTAPFIVENAANLRVDLQVPERLAGQVHPGMAVSVVQDGLSLTGRMLSVGQSIDPVTRALPAKASLPSDSRLIVGQGVMVAIASQQGSSSGQGVTIPAAAITHVDSGDQVFVRTTAGFRPAPVTVAGQIGERAFILAGLRPGDVVATSGVAELKTMSQEL